LVNWSETEAQALNTTSRDSLELIGIRDLLEGDVDSLVRYARILVRGKHFAVAVSCYLSCQRIDPMNVDARFGLAEVDSFSRPGELRRDKAIDILLDFVQSGLPNHLYIRCCIALVRLNRPSAAQKMALRAILSGVEVITASRQIALIHLENNRRKDSANRSVRGSYESLSTSFLRRAFRTIAEHPNVSNTTLREFGRYAEILKFHKVASLLAVQELNNSPHDPSTIVYAVRLAASISDRRASKLLFKVLGNNIDCISCAWISEIVALAEETGDEALMSTFFNQFSRFDLSDKGLLKEHNHLKLIRDRVVNKLVKPIF
jgi:hypothetical protein